MANDQQIRDLYDATVYGEDGDKLGSVGQVYLDDQTGEPEWVTVKTGMFGGQESFVPLASATVSGDEVRVPYSKDLVKDAPRMDEDGDLSETEEDRLYRHYGFQSEGGRVQETTGTTQTTATGVAGTGVTGTDADRDRRDRAGDAGVEGRDTSGPTTDDAMTRSEEQVRVGTQTRESGRARLRKHIVTERQTDTVSVSHDELRVEREPITDANRGDATSGSELSEEEHEVVLHEERPVVEKTVEAVERVRLGTETVQEQEQVSTDVRKEEIEIEGDGVEGTGRSGDRH